MITAEHTCRNGSAEYAAMELTGSGKVIGNIYCGNRAFSPRAVGYIVNRHDQRNG